MLFLEVTIKGDLYTPSSIGTLSGATAIVFFITNGCQRAWNFNPKWFGLVVSIIVSLCGVYFLTDGEPVQYFCGIVNGFVIYASAGGSTQAAASIATGTGQSPGTAVARGLRKRQFLSPWW